MDFVLTQVDQPPAFKMMHITDLHISGSAGSDLPPIFPDPFGRLTDPDMVANFLRDVPAGRGRSPAVDFVVATGDLTNFGSPDQYIGLREALEVCSVPVFPLPGNHDHMTPAADAPLDEVPFTCDPSTWEEYLGPRWYSFDYSGVHFVALDWITHELGIDRHDQEAWLRSDLEQIPPTMPWVLLSHDQPNTGMLNAAQRLPVASFTGHRHTSRIVDVTGVLHVNTPSAFFASLDCHPSSYRLAIWDKERFSLKTYVNALQGPESATFAPSHEKVPRGLARWVHRRGGAGHLAPPAVSQGIVVTAIQREDASVGGIEALSLEDGKVMWSAGLTYSLKTRPLISCNIVITLGVSGDVAANDLWSGEAHWVLRSQDSLMSWGFRGVAEYDKNVIVGEPCLAAISTETGQVEWQREDLGSHTYLVSHAAPIVVEDTIITGSWGVQPALIGLDAASGRTRWSIVDDETLGDVTFSGSWPLSTPTYDSEAGSVIVTTAGAIFSIDPRSGVLNWRTDVGAFFTLASPVSVDSGIIVVLPGRAVVALDRHAGSILWKKAMKSHSSPFTLACYDNQPSPLFAAPVPILGMLVLPGLDGRLHLLDQESGALLRSIDVGAPVASPPVMVDRTLLLCRVDGSVLAIDWKQIL